MIPDPQPAVVTVVDHIKLGRPPLLTADGFTRLAREISSASEGGAPAIVITPIAPETFCAGADLEDVEAYLDEPSRYLRQVEACWRAIEQASIPVVVAVDGPAVGAGCELCLCADAVVASEHAWFSLPEARFGLPPISAARRLAAAVGRLRARRIVLGGERLPASEAAAIGLVAELCSPAELTAVALRLAATLGRSDPTAVGALKAVLAEEATDLDAAALWLRSVISSRQRS